MVCMQMFAAPMRSTGARPAKPILAQFATPLSCLDLSYSLVPFQVGHGGDDKLVPHPSACSVRSALPHRNLLSYLSNHSVPLPSHISLQLFDRSNQVSKAMDELLKHVGPHIIHALGGKWMEHRRLKQNGGRINPEPQPAPSPSPPAASSFVQAPEYYYPPGEVKEVSKRPRRT